MIGLFLENKRYSLYILLVCIVVSMAFLVQLFRMPTCTIITMFDVPGESILVRSAMGHNFVFDGGLNNSSVKKISSVFPFWNKTIDGLFLSHPDTDHIGGAEKILNTFSVQTVFISGSHHDSKIFRDFLENIKSQKIDVVFLYDHQDVRFGTLTLDTLHPSQPIIGQNIAKENNASLVIRMTNEKKSLLLTGDIEKKTEEILLSSSKKITSNILKIPHHGSKSSSSQDFLLAVNPKKAIISAYKNNPFSHPHKEVLSRLHSLLVPYEVTRYNGDINLLF